MGSPRDYARKPATRTGMPAAMSVSMSTSATAEALNRLTSSVLDAAIQIHRALGPGLLENAYLTCLVFELTEAKLRIERQRAVPLVYKGVTVDCAYRADLVVEGCVLIEVKAQESLAPIHSRQVQTYLRLGDLPCRFVAELWRTYDEGWDQADRERLPRRKARGGGGGRRVKPNAESAEEQRYAEERVLRVAALSPSAFPAFGLALRALAPSAIPTSPRRAPSAPSRIPRRSIVRRRAGCNFPLTESSAGPVR